MDISKPTEFRAPIGNKITTEYLDDIAKLCAYSGKTYAEISKEIGKNEEYIYTLRSRYPYLVEKTDEFMAERFKEMASAGLEETIRLMTEADSEVVRLNAAKDILSRAGYDSVKRVENTNKEITVELYDEEKEES